MVALQPGDCNLCVVREAMGKPLRYSLGLGVADRQRITTLLEFKCSFRSPKQSSSRNFDRSSGTLTTEVRIQTEVLVI